MAWQKLDSVTLTGTADKISLTVNSVKFYQVFGHFLDSSSINALIRFNGDSTNNYAFRESSNGATDTTGVNTSLIIFSRGSGPSEIFSVGYGFNLSSEEKLVIVNIITSGTAGAGNAPDRREAVSKWVNVIDAINQIDADNTGAGDYVADSNFTALGTD